ncbi:MAG: efflux transporter outer membrane subunit [Desulfuromonadales bacterium]|nr:efflux transporter outer membrane subunit [Desulfuromonadales bacterium]
MMLCVGPALAGCATLAPDYQRPEAPVPQNWPQGAAYQSRTELSADKTMADLSWQTFFTDPNLRTLIANALEHNRDLREATLNIERARAQYRIQRSGLFPAVNAGAGFSRQHDPGILTGSERTWEQFDVNLGLSSWEIDFFGRLRSLKKQALEAYLASEEARSAAQISLISEVAASYLRLAAAHEQLSLAEETLKSHQATYDLTHRRFEAGVASELEVRQASTTVEGARIQIAVYTRIVAEGENALRLLTGTELPTDRLPDSLSQVVDINLVSAGLPSEVLLRRPDILAAEHHLKGAYANIGAARAAFFPRISLTASAGLASTELSDLFDSDSRAWTFAPGLTLPIFNAGSLRARLAVSKVDRDILLTRYEGAIQAAFREVSDALAQRSTIDEEIAAQTALVEATAATYRLSEARFSKGISSFLNVLDSQRALFSAQQNLINALLARQANQVTLYRVMGGGV